MKPLLILTIAGIMGLIAYEGVVAPMELASPLYGIFKQLVPTLYCCGLLYVIVNYKKEGQ
jgi:hypothetical protein